MNMLLEIWKQAKSPSDYIVAFWVTGLLSLAILGITGFIYNWIINPNAVGNASFGIFDTLG